MAVDFFGRDAGSMNVEDLMPSLNSAFGSAQKMGSEKSDTNKVFEKFAAKIEKSVVDINKQLKDTHKVSQEIKKSGGTKSKEKKSTAEAATMKATTVMQKDMHKFVENATRKGSIFTHDEGLHRRVDQLIAAVGNGGAGGGATTFSPTGAGGFGGKGGTPSGAAPGAGGGAQHTGSFIAEGLKDFKPMWSAIAGQIGGGMEYWQHLLGGLFDQEIKFRREMTMIAFQTQGITGDTKNLQKAWFEVGEVVAQTGGTLTEFQQMYTKNLVRGMKSQKQAISITKSGLNLATMIGSSANDTAATFAEWNMTLGLSEESMADLSRGIQDVAKWTGVTGDKLMAAVKNSEQFVRRMKAAGTVTSDAAENVIMLMAEAEKLGVANEMQGMMSGMANSADLLLRSSKETKRLLFMSAGSVGRVNDLMKGSMLQTKGGIKDMAKGMDNVFKRFSGGFGVKDIDKMTENQKNMTNIRLEAAGLGGIEDFAKQQEVLQKSGMGFAERLQDVNAELEMNLTAEERKAAELKKQNLMMNSGLGMTNKLYEMSKKDKALSMEGAVAKMRNTAGWNDMIADLQAGGNLKVPADKATDKDVAMAMGMQSAKGLKQAGGTDFTGQMQKAINNSDMASFRDLQEKMSIEAQKMGVQQAKAVNPIEQTAQYTNLMNEYLRNSIGPALWGILGALGAGGLLAINLGSMIGATNLGNKMMGGLFGKIGGLFGGAGNAATNTVADSAGAFASMTGSMGKKASGAIPAVAAGAGDAAGAAMEGGATSLGGADKAGGMLSKLNLGSLMKLAPKLALGAAVLLVLTPAIILLAGALIKISKAVMSFMGIDPKEAAETAKAVGALILSAGVIALAVVGMAAVATGLGALVMLASGPQLLFVLGAMALGAIALMALAPAMIALAAAVVHISKATMSALSMDPAKAAETASAVASLMMSAGTIATAVLMSAVALTVLGAMVPFAYGILPFMLLGAGALMLLAPGMIALAAAVVLISKATMAAISMDPAQAATTASAVASLMESAGKIASCVLMSMLTLTVLGVLGSMALIIAPLMAAGAGALMILTPAIISLSAAVVNIAQSTMKAVGTDAKQAAQVAADVGGLIEGSTDIAKKILVASSKIAFMGQFALLAPFIGLSMRLATVAFLIIADSLADYMNSVVVMGTKMGKLAKSGEIENITKSMKDIFDLTDLLVQNIVGFENKLSPLMDKGWFGLSSSPLEILFKGMANLLRKGIIEPVKEFFPDQAEMETAFKAIDVVRKSLEDFSLILNSIEKITNQMNGKKFNNLDGMVSNVNKATTSVSKLDFGGINSAANTAPKKSGGGGIVTSASTPPNGEAGTVNPVPLYNVHDWLEKKRAGLKGGEKGSEMLSIDESAKRQVQIQTEMLEALYMLVEAVGKARTVGNSAPPGMASTTPNISPSNSPDYNNWSQSSYGSNANIALAPTGV